MEDRRKLERKYLLMYSRVYDMKSGKLLGYLADLSPGGAMIIGDDALQTGAAFELQLDLPEYPPFPLKVLKLSARVAHCEPDLDPRFHDIGFEFLGVRSEQAKVIEQMMEAYEFRRKNK